jgi:hypothetical protein
MLEDGEIDGEEELLTNSPSPQNENTGTEEEQDTQTHQKSHRSKKSSRKHGREKKQQQHYDMDDRLLNTQVDSDELSAGSHKRKSKSSSSGSSSKRNRKHQQHAPSMDLLEEEMNEPNYDENSIGGDIDERFIPANNIAIPSIYNTHALSPDQVNIVSSFSLGVNPLLSQQTTASLLDLFKTTPGLFGASTDPVLFEKENSKPVKKKTLLSKPDPMMGPNDGDRRRKVLLQTPDETEMTVSVESIEKKVN